MDACQGLCRATPRGVSNPQNSLKSLASSIDLPSQKLYCGDPRFWRLLEPVVPRQYVSAHVAG